MSRMLENRVRLDTANEKERSLLEWFLDNYRDAVSKKLSGKVIYNMAFELTMARGGVTDKQVTVISKG